MKLLAATAFASLLMATVPAQATVYNFTEGGYDDGATAFGSFTGSDLDGDGVLNSFAGEVTDFSFNFSGSATVAPFTLGFDDLIGLIYNFDGALGDNFDEGVIADGPNGIFIVAALAPLCDGVTLCGAAEDSLGNFDPTTAPLTVTVAGVPEPAIWAMMIAGFALIGTALRRRPASGAGRRRYPRRCSPNSRPSIGVGLDQIV